MAATDNVGSGYMHMGRWKTEVEKQNETVSEWVSVQANDWMNWKYHTVIQVTYILLTMAFFHLQLGIICVYQPLSFTHLSCWTDLFDVCAGYMCACSSVLYVCVCVCVCLPIINMKISSHYHYYWHIFWIAFTIKLQFCLIFHRIRSIQCSSHIYCWIRWIFHAAITYVYAGCVRVWAY